MGTLWWRNVWVNTRWKRLSTQSNVATGTRRWGFHINENWWGHGREIIKRDEDEINEKLDIMIEAWNCTTSKWYLVEIIMESMHENWEKGVQDWEAIVEEESQKGFKTVKTLMRRCKNPSIITRYLQSYLAKWRKFKIFQRKWEQSVQ
jgi:hypothetical protein